MVTELSLFTGAGGGLLGTKLLGFKHIGYVEFNDFCQRVLAQRIKDGIIDNAPIFGDIRTFISEGYATSYKGLVDVITGGFPCQPFSTAGSGGGEFDPRNMWPSTIECIRIIRPRFALLENVPALLGFEYFWRIIGDITEAGYDCKWITLSCADCGGPIIRNRLWIFASSKMLGRERSAILPTEPRNLGKHKHTNHKDNWIRGWLEWKNGNWRKDEKNNGQSLTIRDDDGMGRGMDRLKAIGNGQVPAVVKTAWRILSGN